MTASILRSSLAFIFIAAVIVLGAQHLRAEPVHTIINNGSSQNRVDIAILGDGYTASQLAQYHADVQTFVAGIFAQEPYREYQRYYNVHMIDVVSKQSGSDHPELSPPVLVNTALDSSYNCMGIVRLICVDQQKVVNVLDRSLIPGQFDVILVLVNDTEYGGSGGGISVASKDSAAIELILHEVGHGFGLLADEFVGGGGECDPDMEPSEPNATRETQRSAIKWNHWIDATTIIPTTSGLPGLPGLFEGSKYCASGLYRPTFRSKMNVLGFPFEQINSEQLVKRIYSFVSPLDSRFPATTSIALRSDQEQLFTATKMEPLTHTLSQHWELNGQLVGVGSSFLLKGSDVANGDHVVRVLIKDESQFVRNDPQQLLSTSRSWNVNVRPAERTPFDYDADGRADLSVQRPATNFWYLLRSSAGYMLMEWGAAGDRLVPADYDADAKTDVAVFRPSLGQWFFFMSGTQTFQSVRWGVAGDLPVPTDRDGDGRADLVLYRPSNSIWYTKFANGSLATTEFGVAGDKPLLGDFDADGIGDIALFRPSNNNWYILKSSLGFFIQTWGETGDIPVPADFDGDGATDQGVFRPSTGQWFLSRTTEGFGSQSWGHAGDIPVAADYDGDGRADIAVFRPSNATWYIVNSSTGQLIQQFGQPGDLPTQSAFIY